MSFLRVKGQRSKFAPRPPAIDVGSARYPEIEPNDIITQANNLPGGYISVLGNIYPNADVDYFAFTASAGDRVYAATSTSFSANGSSDSRLRLLNAAGVVLELDEDDGSLGGLSSTIAGATLPATGTYYLQVNHFSATSQLRPYVLYLRTQSGAPAAEVEPNNDIGTATPLPATGWASGAIQIAGDTDFYSLSLNAGETVFLSLDLDPERDGITWNGRLGLGVFNNNILVVNDASSVSPNSEAFFLTVKESGTYYIYVDYPTAAARQHLPLERQRLPGPHPNRRLRHLHQQHPSRHRR